MEKGEWVKKSNGSGGNNCVAVMYVGEAIYVKNDQELVGAKLKFTESEWKYFIQGAKEGLFDI